MIQYVYVYLGFNITATLFSSLKNGRVSPTEKTTMYSDVQALLVKTDVQRKKVKAHLPKFELGCHQTYVIRDTWFVTSVKCDTLID